MIILSDGESICRVGFIDQKRFTSPENLIRNDSLAIFQKAKGFLDDYFNGMKPEISFNLKPGGSEFQHKVWKIVSEIEYGETLTYGEIASRISPTMSAQAVGGAVGRNPIAIMIPCHRVLGLNGRLTGYAAGLERKAELLKLERIL